MQQTAHPSSSIAAVTHPNPYPYYANLVAHTPFYFDHALGCWVASSAAAVQAVLSSAFCRVRPITEPIPKHLLGSSAADIFQCLVRMNDDQLHQTLKPAIKSTLTTLDLSQIHNHAKTWAHFLIAELRPHSYTNRLSDFGFQLPIYVIASLLGVPDVKLPQAACWISQFITCLAPSSSASQLETGQDAAHSLLDLFYTLLSTHEPDSDSLLATLAQRVKHQCGHYDTNAIIANAIGFLMQAYEATAGLIANTLIALARYDHIRRQILANPTLLPSAIHEVLRYDSPVQNTRRYVAENQVLMEHPVQAGDTILVILAAANHDPTANSHPGNFDIFRTNRQIFSFGLGIHGCPGEKLATTVTTAALEQLITSGFRLDQITTKITYRPSINTRIPIFGARSLQL